MRTLFFLMTFSLELLASEYVYHPKWMAIYKGLYGSTILTRINNDYGWKVPHHDCKAETVKELKAGSYHRKLTCKEKSVLLECKAKDQEVTKCDVELAGVTLHLEIRRFLTMRALRKKQLKEELENEIPY
ncbi:MAG: hypothetical protein ACPGJV_09780 [Bacteriovoracaceae bacterium]